MYISQIGNSFSEDFSRCKIHNRLLKLPRKTQVKDHALQLCKKKKTQHALTGARVITDEEIMINKFEKTIHNFARFPDIGIQTEIRSIVPKICKRESFDRSRTRGPVSVSLGQTFLPTSHQKSMATQKAMQGHT